MLSGIATVKQIHLEDFTLRVKALEVSARVSTPWYFIQLYAVFSAGLDEEHRGSKGHGLPQVNRLSHPSTCGDGETHATEARFGS